MSELDSMIREYERDAENLRNKRQRTAKELLNRRHGRLESILTDVVDMIAEERVQRRRRSDLLDFVRADDRLWVTVRDRLQAIDNQEDEGE